MANKSQQPPTKRGGPLDRKPAGRDDGKPQRAAPAPVRGGPVAKGAPPGKGAPPAGDNHRHASLEAGKALQRLLDAAPGAQKGRQLDASSTRVAEQVLANAAKIELHVPVMAAPTAADIKARVDELRTSYARVERRRTGDVLEAGDEVELTLTGYVGGKVFLAKIAQWYWIRPNPALPGFFESLVGASVGESKIIQVRLPADYPVPAQANRLAVFAVEVKEAQRRMPPNANDPTFLAWVGRGKTVAELERTIQNEIISSRGMDMVNHAKLLFLRELYLLSEDPIPDDFVEDELRKRWRERKGEALIQIGMSLDEQKESQNEYLHDPVMREEARRSVWELRVLEAIADFAGIEQNDEQLNGILSDTAVAAAVPDRVIQSVMEKNEALRKGIQKNFRMNQALMLLLSKGRIFFDAPPTPPELVRARIGQKRLAERDAEAAAPAPTVVGTRGAAPLVKGLGADRTHKEVKRAR